MKKMKFLKEKAMNSKTLLGPVTNHMTHKNRYKDNIGKELNYDEIIRTLSESNQKLLENDGSQR